MENLFSLFCQKYQSQIIIFLQEFDDPYILLSDSTSSLYRLAQQTGKSTAAGLLQTAKAVSGWMALKVQRIGINEVTIW